MRESENSAEQNAETTNDHIRNAQERVLAPHNGASGDENGLGPAVLLYGETYPMVSDSPAMTSARGAYDLGFSVRRFRFSRHRCHFA